ncbi:MAG: hypothetical protein AMXMBFR46_24750 [Acidimicrobiia bacterium]
MASEAGLELVPEPYQRVSLNPACPLCDKGVRAIDVPSGINENHPEPARFSEF